MKIKDRVALVTGSGQGLGKAIAFALANEGAKLAINDISLNEVKARETVSELRKIGTDAKVFLADVTQESEVNKMVEEILARFSRIDILVNNAGINRDGLIHKGNLQNWNAVMNVNLTGPFICTKAVLPSIRQNNYGRIVNISSLTARLGISGTGYYASAKSGLIGLTKVTAVENMAQGITCNALAPGYIKTDMMMKYPEEQLQALIARIPAGRLAEPAEIADVVVFVAADSASYMTGAVIDINGGCFI
ncbi:SDR family NAD(P)-dependent oxidoreductase [Desulfosporosinus nitroreducens]|uniref:3-oxoacyl-ACP reductase FabG n=1 Tax=Desulfosporosinus nitroreducens TaxID=2018668 RepID=A0ABT8QP85_9FIRM|nr:3-oxoacyl-ACP reductase FabG [Desulfosporosinus nitroreducens]MDO0822647.1 3-oxoacyl-ACP reductase FabG [Desulfosporosinus nitroreducens]